MSWRNLAAVSLLLLSGCGFHPLYEDSASEPALAPQLASIHVRQISDRYGQEMTNELRDALNPNALDVDGAYELHVTLVEQKADILMRADGTNARTNSSLSAKWELLRLSDKQVVTKGTSRAVTGHDVLPNEYANVVGVTTDITRAVHEVSAEIETRLAYYFQLPQTHQADDPA